jgi:hypothetical protein
LKPPAVLLRGNLARGEIGKRFVLFHLFHSHVK